MDDTLALLSLAKVSALRRNAVDRQNSKVWHLYYHQYIARLSRYIRFGERLDGSAHLFLVVLNDQIA